MPILNPAPTVQKMDSSTAISLLTTPDEISNRNKHVDVTYFWIREAARQKKFSFVHVPGTDNVADIFTKALAPSVHAKHTATLGLSPPMADASR